MSPNRFGFYFFWLALSFLAAGCGRPAQNPQIQHSIVATDEAAFGDTLVEGAIADAISLNPWVSNDSSSNRVQSMIYNGLIKFDQDLSYAPDLAESWNFSPDGLELTFKLKRNVKWHDGEDFSSDDVVFSYSNQSFTVAQYVKTVEALDRYTVKVTYLKPYSPALQNYSLKIIPRHIFKNYDFHDNTEFNSHPIGTGPYKFKEWTSGEQVVLEANENYFEGRPFLDRYIFKVIPDSSMAFLALLRQDLDILRITPDQYVKQADSDEFKKYFLLYRCPSPASFCTIGYNEKEAIFQDRRVRQALTMAIDRQELIKNIFYGFAETLDGPWVKTNWAYDNSIVPLPYSPDKARQLMGEAGWVDKDNDSVLERDGKKFEVKITALNGEKIHELLAKAAIDFWSRIGVRAKLELVDGKTLKELCFLGTFDALIGQWGTYDPDLYYFFHRWEIPEPEKNKNGKNFVAYSNTLEVDALIQAARTTMEVKARIELYHKLQAVIYRDQPYTFLCAPDVLYAANSRIHGLKVSPAGIFCNTCKLNVPKDLQKYRSQTY
ncbi:MAG: peptide-binding protein [Candidatus Wallbacteria bacterium]|nr:peptide-binding protein [Candidatus Wallbacteria bacterium]